MSVINIKAIGAKNLKSVTTFERQDPYLTLEISPTDLSILDFVKNVQKTQVHEDGGRSATWNENFVFEVQDHTKVTLTLAVFNDNYRKDDMIGRVRVDLAPIFAKHAMDEIFEETIQLVDQSNVSKTAGNIMLTLQWHNEAMRIKEDASVNSALTELEKVKRELEEAKAAATKAAEVKCEA